MAVGTCHAALRMDARRVKLVIRVLRLDHRGAAEGMCPVDMAALVERRLDRLHVQPLIPRERQVEGLGLEIVLDVALRADERPHLLMAHALDVDTSPVEGLEERRPRDAQVHRRRVVAVLATDGVDDLRSEERRVGKEWIAWAVWCRQTSKGRG